MNENSLQGWVTRAQSGFYTVDTELGPVMCSMRGKLKRKTGMVDFIAVGDRVQIIRQVDGSGRIEGIDERSRSLVRLDPRPKGVYQQVLLANPDQIILVFACASPEPHLRMLDRFLVICEKQGIPVFIVANKVDLVGLEQANELFSVYPSLGYPSLFTSTRNGMGLEELRQLLQGKISGLAGPSGVGKSSLLNALQPDLGLAVREISEARQRGMHTTVVRQLFPLDGGGYVADLPGLRSLSLWDTQPEELDGYFPELRGLVSECQFNDCTHEDEPGCAVRLAVESGKVNPERYESYLRLRFGE
jgi:ribosome biogenesis GTPase / thiamine phosphate phosphatase